MKVDFCTTCLGRGAQLQAALPINLALALQFRDTMKFHVVLFSGGRDNVQESTGLRRWFQEELSDAMEMGVLVLAESEKEFWNVPSARTPCTSSAC